MYGVGYNMECILVVIIKLVLKIAGILCADTIRMKYLAAIILLLIPLLSEGQNGFFAKPSYSIGFSNMVLKSDTRNIQNKKGVFSNAISLAFGYEYNNIRINTGLGYLKTGYKIKDYTTIYFHLQPFLSDGIFLYDHFIVPLEVSYVQKLSKSLSVVPGAGIVFCANLGESIVYKNAETTLKYSVNTVDFKSIYHSVSFLAHGNVAFEYNLAENLSLCAGPSVYYMVPSFLKQVHGFADKQHNYAVVADIGVVLHIRKPARKRANY